MDGIIIVNKPKDYTSRDIVNIVSKSLKTKKIGHTGTLDPLATGVLVLCIGRATKLVELLTASDKEYIAEITLGIETDTLDITGKILREEEKYISKEKIKIVLDEFKGSYEQEVPIYSAIKINGRKLYEYARNGQDVILPKRNVTIKDIKLINDIKYENKQIKFWIQTTVSKGTYIRSLVRDIASKLGTIGVMSNLQRIKQGTFKIQDSYTLEEIQNKEYKMVSLNEALKNYNIVKVDESEEFKIKNGCILPNVYHKKIVTFVNKDNKVIAIYKQDGQSLKVYKMMM